MYLSTRQPRQTHNRKCASAAGESTIVSHLFEGQLSYMTICMHCDHQAHSTQTFTVLSLPIPTDTSKCSIQVTCHTAVSPTLWTCAGRPVLVRTHSLTLVIVLCRTACHCSSSRPSWPGESRSCVQCVNWGEKQQSSHVWKNLPRSSHCTWNGG